MKLSTLAALTALSLSTAAHAGDSAAQIAVCLDSQYAMALSAIEREARDLGAAAGMSEAAIDAQIDPAIEALAKSLEDGRLLMAQHAERDVWEALNLAENAFSGNDSVSRTILRAIQVCIL
jgi:hypothetical protein